MINNISTGSSGGYLYVDNGYTNMPYVSPNSNNPMTGMLRMNGSNMEVFDGTSWLHVGMSNPIVNLNQTAVQALDWCQRKMIEEAKINDLAAKSPTVADALNAYNEARGKLEMVLTLTDGE